MTLLPRTLLWRTVLLLAVLLAVSHLAWITIFSYAQREPRANQFAQQIVSIVVLTRAAMVSAAPGKRVALLRELSSAEGIQVYAARDDESIEPLPDRPLLKLIAAAVREQLGPDTRITLARDGIPGVWVSFPIDEDEYWVMVPRARLERPETWRWVGLGVVVLLLSVLGAVAIVSRVNRPLRALARAAADLGRGREPAPVPEAGPAEISGVAKAFNQMAADLQSTERERALMLAGVSHDLRTPLSRIRLGVEMLDVDGALREGMVQDVEEMDAIVGQFLDFARGGPEGAETNATDTDLDALVARVVERYRAKGQPVNARAGGLPLLPLRALAIERLLTNLINNALRHANTPVEVETRVEGKHAVLSVLDRGPGIPDGDAERMMQPFTRLSTARTDSGSGLGLAIVERIARMHHGKLELLARVGGGLEARVLLPLSQA
jgi:two-component system osmolarity sensor histidine kinase EnvZ